MSSLPFQRIQPPFLQSSSPPSSSSNSNPSHPNSSKVMNRSHTATLPELLAHTDDSTSLEGVIANVKLILKLLQEHKHAAKEDESKKAQRLAGILRILDDVRSRIELCSLLSGRRKAELRRCKTDILRSHPVTSNSYPAEENLKLRREIAAVTTARKSLESMFASLGREKEMIAGELARKVQELGCAEEVAGDLRAENKMLWEKVRACAADHRGYGGEGGGGGGEEAAIGAIQGKNTELGKQLLRSLEMYKTGERGLKEAEKKTAGSGQRTADGRR